MLILQDCLWKICIIRVFKLFLHSKCILTGTQITQQERILRFSEFYIYVIMSMENYHIIPFDARWTNLNPKKTALLLDGNLAEGDIYALIINSTNKISIGTNTNWVTFNNIILFTKNIDKAEKVSILAKTNNGVASNCCTERYKGDALHFRENS